MAFNKNKDDVIDKFLEQMEAKIEVFKFGKRY